MSTAAAPRAAIYTRLSIDRNGEGVAVKRQKQDCLRIATERGWDVVGDFCDDSKSAWRAGVRRPEWESMLDLVADDGVDALVVWHGDGLIRQPRDLERLIDLAESGLTIASVAGERDLSKADDRFILRIETAAQCRESDSTSRRVKRALEEKAMRGERPGQVPYGWRNELEADVVRRIVRDVLAGRSVRWLTRELNEAGVPAANGGQWDKSSVRYIARRPANAGLRTHKGDVVGVGDWDPLITVEQHEAVVRAFAATAGTPSRVTRRWMLTGLLKCGICGGADTVHAVVNGRRVYRCSVKSHLSVGAQAADDLILDIVQARLDKPDAREATAPSSGESERVDLSKRIAEMNRVAKEFAEDRAAGLISREAMRAGVAKAEANAKELSARLSALELHANATEDLPADIRSAPVDVQRAVIDTLMTLTAVPLAKGASARYAPIESRIEVTWR